ncbi:C-type lectin domain family 2 member B isoform X2 [Tamandua tetradactyla]|uniref:C-type lectin domain family 2 member B isoform X2 n=1 Tax=Tamandua tetradactyla TaxID=48850 RepID=UPI004054305A
MTQSIQNPAYTEEYPATDNSNQRTDANIQGFCDRLKKQKAMIACLSISVALNIFLTVQLSTTPLCEHPHSFCPDDWIGFHNNCYFFSKEERDWNSSRCSCTSEHADLTIIDTMKEINFLIRHKGSSDHWIGLTMTGNQIGKWVNGATLNKCTATFFAGPFMKNLQKKDKYMLIIVAEDVHLCC